MHDLAILKKQETAAFPLAKVQELPDGSLYVYCLVTKQAQDKDGETCHYESTKSEYQNVSGEMAKASQNDNLMPVREMHQLSAVGATKKLDYDDATKSIYAGAKIIDPLACKKIREKVYIGGSQGGNYLKKWREGDVNFYTAKPGEWSLVDNPCLGDAIFQQEYHKLDGTVELRKVECGIEKGIKYLAGEGHLPYTDESGKPDHRHMGAAWAALHGGYRGNKYQGPDKEKAIAHLKEIYHSEGIEPPSEKAAALITELSKVLEFCGDSELDTELAKFHALTDGLVAKLSAQGDNMNPEQIKKCATALGISEAEFQKQFLDEGKPLAKGHSMAALHAAIEKAHSHHEDMMAMHEKMGKAHAAMATHLGKCMKACKGLMGTEEESEKAVKALMAELKIAPVETEEEKIAKAAAEKAKGFTTTNHELAALIKAEVEKGVKEAVEKLPKNDESDRAQLFAVRRGELEKSKAAQPSNDSIPV